MQQINIVGIIFQISDDALPALKAYKQSLYFYFYQQQDGQEILADIENRIAEIFWETCRATPIALAQVEDMIKQMGEVADFEALEHNPAYSLQSEVTFQKPQNQQEKALLAIQKGGFLEKKSLSFPIYSKEVWDISYYNPSQKYQKERPQYFYRDTANAWIGGVASGLSDYFGVEPWAVRLLLLFGCFSGVLILFYLFLWVTLPQKGK